MTYRVIALKWRPQTFEEIVGQEHVTRTLQNALRLDRVPHAFLFTGSRGVGKTTTARILAKALVCEKGPTEHPCGTCRFCEEVRDGRALDVLEIDGASNTGVDNVRELRENAVYAPSAGRFKIYIIDEVHMLSKGAFNALLKILEEPPLHVKFMFATTEISKVPTTIQSRCQRFDFRLLGRDEIARHLRKIVDSEGITISDGALHIIATAAEGSLRDSQSLLDQVLAYCGKEVREEDVHQALGIAEEKTVRSFIGSLASRDAARCYGLLDEQVAAGSDLKAFVRDVLTGLRDLALMSTSPELERFALSSVEGVEELKENLAILSPGRIHGLFDIFLRAEADLRNTTFPRMTLELAVLRAVRLEEVEELRSLLERLENLSRNIKTAPAAVPLPHPERRPSTSPPAVDREEHIAPRTAPSGTGDEEVSSAPYQSPASPDSRGDLFARLIDRVRKESSMFASFLEHGSLATMTEEALEIRFAPGDRFFVEQLSERESAVLLRKAAAEISGRKIDVRLSLDEEESGVEARRARETDQKKKYRREALENPLIMSVLEVFQAQVVDVKIL